MLDFLRTLYRKRKLLLRMILIEEDHPDEVNEYVLKPESIFQFAGLTGLMLVVLLITIFGLTPLGPFLFDKEDDVLRSRAAELQQKVIALNDSLTLRDQQLAVIKNVIFTNEDTVFRTDYIGDDVSRFQPPLSSGEQSEIDEADLSNTGFTTPVIDANNIIGSRLLEHSISFPAQWPVDGTMTRTFEPENQHFGIDIASSEGAFVSSIADGIVMTSVWTMNYGYVIQIQHADGYTSVYKHCSLPLKKEGDTVLGGDIIGIIGESGLISSGPHVHIELWRNGIALDPELFLISNS